MCTGIPEETNKRYGRLVCCNSRHFSSEGENRRVETNERKRVLPECRIEVFPGENSISVSFFLHRWATKIHRPKEKNFVRTNERMNVRVDRLTEHLSIFRATSSLNFTLEIVPVWSVKFTFKLKTSFVENVSTFVCSNNFIRHSASTHSPFRTDRLQKILKPKKTFRKSSLMMNRLTIGAWRPVESVHPNRNGWEKLVERTCRSSCSSLNILLVLERWRWSPAELKERANVGMTTIGDSLYRWSFRQAECLINRRSGSFASIRKVEPIRSYLNAFARRRNEKNSSSSPGLTVKRVWRVAVNP